MNLQRHQPDRVQHGGRFTNDDITIFVPNQHFIALAERTLGRRPKVPLKMGLAATVAQFRTTLRIDGKQAVAG